MCIVFDLQNLDTIYICQRLEGKHHEMMFFFGTLDVGSQQSMGYPRRSSLMVTLQVNGSMSGRSWLFVLTSHWKREG